jgi:predicted permease
MDEWRSAVRSRLTELGLDPDAHPSLVEELAQHLDERFRTGLALGAEPDAARAAALAELDGSERIAIELRAERRPASPIVPGIPRGRLGAGLWQDLKYALRTLRRSPAFTVAAVLTIALGTGPTVAALGVANWLFFRPMPGVHEPDRLGVVSFGRRTETDDGFSSSRLSYTRLQEIRSRLTTIEDIAGYQPSMSLNLSLDAGVARVIEAQFVTANYFDVLGVHLAEGRAFRSDEDLDAGGTTVVVLSHALARSLFPDGAAVGRTLRLNGHVFEVIGVTRSGFEGSQVGNRPALWLPGRTMPRLNHLPPTRWAYSTDTGPFDRFLIRLRRGATFAEAEADLGSGARRAFADRPDPAAAPSTAIKLVPQIGLDPFARESLMPFATMLVGVAGLLVMLAAANLVNLFMFRGARRLHEAALRRSLGASAARLAQLHVVEALLVSITGALLGIAIVAATKGWLNGLVFPGVGILEIAFDWRLFAVTLALATAIGVLLGAAPARLAARRSLTATLALGQRSSTTTGGRFRTGLAVVQLALSLTLLIGGLLFVQTLKNLRGVDLGFDTSGVATFSFALRGQAYDTTRTREFYRELVNRLGATPRVEAASAATGLPLMSRSSFRVLPPDIAALQGQSNKELFDLGIRSLSNEVTSDYFRAFGIRVLFGRTFTESEAYTPGAEPGVVISESLAERLFGTSNAVGQTLSFPGQGALPRHDAPVIGVVTDVRWRGPRESSDFIVYRPFGDLGINGTLVVRSTLARADVSGLVRAAAAAIDAAVPIQFDLSMNQIFDRRNAQQLIFAWVLGILASIGFALAAVGIYGLVSQAVLERVREFGIRLAIGAPRAGVARLVLRQAVVIVAIGVPIGMLIAGLSSRLIAAQLFGVAPLAVGVYLAATAALLVAVFAAVIHPVVRAVRVNPVDVMRAE